MQERNQRTVLHVVRVPFDGLELKFLRPGMVLLILAGLLLAGCSPAPIEASSEPAIVEPSDREGINRVILTARAAERLDIQTTQVREEEVDGATRLVVPYGALIYDLQGDTWLYTNPDELTYIRESITVDYIEGDNVYLTDGPAVGTEVVAVGVAELYGTDTGVGK